MQHLLHEVCSRQPLVPVGGSSSSWKERDMDGALVTLMVTWRQLTAQEVPPPPALLVGCMIHLCSLETLEEAGRGDRTRHTQGSQQQGRQGRRARQRHEARWQTVLQLDRHTLELALLRNQVRHVSSRGCGAVCGPWLNGRRQVPVL
jgi:hypothetical protein